MQLSTFLINDIQTGLVPLDTHLDLHEEVPQVLLEGGDVLIQAEQTRYKHLHLGTEDETNKLLVWQCSKTTKSQT